MFEEALHTYLAVADVAEVSVTGLEGAAFVDEADGFARKRREPTPLRIRGETDRVYEGSDATCVVEDPGARRRLEVAKAGSVTTVVEPGPGARGSCPTSAPTSGPRSSASSGERRRRRGHPRARRPHRLDVSIRSAPWNGA